ncbi:MAG: hypothetical protein Tsb0032_06300 [Kiloniellaceae bacterium]
MAASVAEPPARSISMPALAASGLAAATIWRAGASAGPSMVAQADKTGSTRKAVKRKVIRRRVAARVMARFSGGGLHGRSDAIINRGVRLYQG